MIRANMMSRVKLLLTRTPRLYRWLARTHGLIGVLLGRPHEPDFAALRHFDGRPGVFLDIGANIGQSALSVRSVDRSRPIVSIEANPGLEGDLRLVQRLIPRFRYRIAAASDAPGPLKLRVPSYRGLDITGEGSIDGPIRGVYWLQQQGVCMDSNGFELHEVETSGVRLDDLGLQPAIVKLDIEGGELAALRGLRETLSRHKPVILIERRADPAIEDFLSGLGYKAFVYLPDEDRLEPDERRDSQNVFYLTPDEPPAGADQRAV